MPGSMCAYPDGRQGDIPNTGMVCACDAQGTMRCPGQVDWSKPQLVCTPKVAAVCAAPDMLWVTRTAKPTFPFGVGCPSIRSLTSAQERTIPGAGAACCYQAEMSLCQGRPLRVEGHVVLAPVVRGGWA